jgi:hypothetical protein
VLLFADTAASVQNISEPQFQARSQNFIKRLLSFAMSVCLSVRMEKLGPHWADRNAI